MLVPQATPVRGQYLCRAAEITPSDDDKVPSLGALLRRKLKELPAQSGRATDAARQLAAKPKRGVTA